jgi:Zinc finger, C3HC4 type (RING finger)
MRKLHERNWLALCHCHWLLFKYKYKDKTKMASSFSSNEATRNMILSYPGWQEDKATADRYFAVSPSGSFFHIKIEAMKNKQRLHDGDRSHTDIVTLDSTTYTYPGWKVDKENALKAHCGDTGGLQLGSVQDKLAMMARKELVFQDRHSFDALRELDEFNLSYEGVEDDLAFAERLFVESPASQLFHHKVAAMKVKQAVLVDGDRSHPDIAALESEIWSYPGFEADKEEAMQLILGNCSVLYVGKFAGKFCEMRRKEQVFRDRSRVEELQMLETLSVTYPNWQDDKIAAERLYLAYPSLFQLKVQGMKIKEKLYHGDRTDPDILLLDSYPFSYDGWPVDKQRAIQCITGGSISSLCTFHDVFTEMKNKQEMHSNRHNLRDLQNLDSMLLHHGLKHSETGETEDSLSLSSFGTSEEENEPEKVNRRQEGVCVVCLEKQSTHAHIPCGHLCICLDCAELQDACSHDNGGHGTLKCPLCRVRTICVTRIFH